MKALSLWQPWASLIAIGAKVYETRSWATRYRGPVIIHAAQRRPTLHIDVRDYDARTRIVQALGSACVFDLADLPRGHALCVVELVDCLPVERVRGRLGADELAFGDYSDHRYAWQMRLYSLGLVPVPAAGRQGLFDLPIPWPLAHLAGVPGVAA